MSCFLSGDILQEFPTGNYTLREDLQIITSLSHHCCQRACPELDRTILLLRLIVSTLPL